MRPTQSTRIGGGVPTLLLVTLVNRTALNANNLLRFLLPLRSDVSDDRISLTLTEILLQILRSHRKMLDLDLLPSYLNDDLLRTRSRLLRPLLNHLSLTFPMDVLQ